MTAVKKCTVCDDERKGQNYEYGYGYGYGSASCETPSIWQDVDIADYKILGINKVFICNMCANKNSVPYSTRLRVTRNTLDILAFFFVISWVAGLIAIIKPSLLNNTFINVGPIFLSIDAEPIIIVSVITVLLLDDN